MQRKCSQNAVKLQPKYSQNAVKMQSKYSKMQIKCSQNAVKNQYFLFSDEIIDENNLMPNNHQRKKSIMASLPNFVDFKSPRSSMCKNSSASLQKVEVLHTAEMQIRRTNPGFIGKAKLNTIKITVALVGAFLACWTPYYVMCIW